ncbi:restriction endonuclease subunit S [Sunxiuqinia elliptica]|uniref:Type I restriction modification DNA specificity protein n=1 Tax=Sunxiuqinia elliptica TaxID=655355 RepID=A0A4V3BZ81_9BACT|nr:restriction endonuclease subunit S [Sunxiuqinia elliptica]TDO05399.1 type I restriction modification DNA specificity protein [Sunxiuqinia elliptica]TDO64946.1 type I restriction modification DNA specificity protein [Sunxiuqinia elliptica]
MKNNKTLRDIAKLQFGYYARPDESGSAFYLQVKHFDDSIRFTGEKDAFIDIDKKNEAHILDEGDILFVGKGNRNFAWAYDKAVGKAIASSIFFVIKPDTNQVLPEYLTTILNLPKNQAYFQSLGAGSSIPSIRKSELEMFQVSLPEMSVQKKIVELKRMHELEIQLNDQIAEKKNKLFQEIINQLI